MKASEFESFEKKMRNVIIKTALISGILLLGSQIAIANGTPEPKETEPCHNAGYDGGLYIKTCDDKYKLKINVKLQPQYQFLSMENQDEVNTFQIRRGWLEFSGNAFTKNLTFKFQYEAVGGVDSTTQEGNLRANSLRDAYLNYKFLDGIQIKGGQFKPYFNREELTSSAELQFVGHSIANEVFTKERDLGVALHGAFLDKKLEYGVSLTNEGVGRNTTNANNELLAALRLTYNILGSHELTMSDTKDSQEPHLAVAVAATYNKPSAAADNSIISATGDVAYRYQGFSFLGAGYYGRNHTASTNIFGFSGQTGYFLIPTHLEVVARGAGIIPTSAGVTNGYEWVGGLNYFFNSHNLKIQADYSLLMNSALVFQGAATAANTNNGFAPGFNQDQNDHRVRLQAQLYF